MRVKIIIFLWLACTNLYAQNQVKRSLSVDDFETWNTVSGAVISNDGNTVAFIQNPQRGDGVLIIDHNNTIIDTIPRGKNVKISPDNDFAVFEIKPFEEQIRQAKREKVKKEDMPADSLGIFKFGSNGAVYKFPFVESYEIPDENAKWIAFSSRPVSEKIDSLSKIANDQKIKKKGNNLVLFRLSDTDTMIIPNVSAWIYSKSGKALWYKVEVNDSATYSSVYRFDTQTGEATRMFEKKGRLEKLTTDDQGNQCAFLFSPDTISEQVFALYAGNTETKPVKIVDRLTPGMPIGWAPSQNGNIFFSEDGKKIYFGTSAVITSDKEASIAEEDKPMLDIWSWNDDKLQSQQVVEVESEKKRSYLAVYHNEDKKMVQLGDPLIKEVTTIQRGNADIALGYNNQPYLKEMEWTGIAYRDYYVIDVKSGIKREIADCKSYVRISPQGKYVVWYDSSHKGFYARSTDISRLDAVPLTQMIQVNFFDEDDDRPTDPSPYGIAGWGEDDRFIYIYDRYDLWRIDPSGVRVPVNMTKTFGRRNQIRLRHLVLDDELDHLPTDEEIVLQGFNERTMESGFFSTRLNQVSDPELLVLDEAHYSGVQKAKNADKILWRKESVAMFPDLWQSDIRFNNERRMSFANPQQNQYVWPNVQLVEWLSFSGEKLKGLLYLPENLDASHKVPVVVYFYERNAENIHRHQHPAPSRSTINKTFYASNGYVVFVPDITYKNGYPGRSAYDAVLSGTQYLINTFPFIDEKNIGVQGQSWGGYQVAYLIAHTDLFAAAMAGAPVSNMTSAYGGIRWQTGRVRMFQYERQQSRIGGSLWEKPFQYIENSPLFSAPNVNTPLLIMHNDKDGAVPWSQGIEFFVALRRLNKPVWLLNYNNEPHNLNAASWANRIDLSKRMFQFFNHYLKKETMPQWMERGVPAVEKGRNLGY